MKRGESVEILAEEDRKSLIRAIQDGVPFAPRPFAELGEALVLGEQPVIEGLRELQTEQVLREISAVLEGSALGYESALVAGSVPDERVEEVAEIINEHPTVSHNYTRNHAYNLWFTVAVPKQMDLERTLELLAKETGCIGFHPLRRTQTFKIGVNFDPDSLRNRTAPQAASNVQPIHIGEREVRMLRALQIPLPLVESPFDELAEHAHVETDELLAFANEHLGGAIRRYVGTLRHRKLGVRENGMAVWRVAASDVEVVGERLASAPEVSHCYARNAIEGFPYTLYSMLHGPTRESCHALAEGLSRETGVGDYAVLFSEREFKKQRLRYFLPELDRWWSERTA
ncbi:MAG: Lrp/AsnC family transcriptional regulator [Deltaproteobacteria bacterium]|nr:Lrp/AsnC family transcriptional regulator [Deltaproteobacteria bacterium]